MNLESLAEIAFNAYGEKANWKTYNDNPILSWDGVGENIRERWIAAIEAVIVEIYNVKSWGNFEIESSKFFVHSGVVRMLSVQNCVRCGKDHDFMFFQEFMKPMVDSDGAAWTWWGTCPATGDPILARNDG